MYTNMKKKMFHTKSLVMSMFHLHKQVNVTNFKGSLFITIKQSAKYRFCIATE
jgi:hypothetical protein